MTQRRVAMSGSTETAGKTAVIAELCHCLYVGPWEATHVHHDHNDKIE